MKVSLSKLAPVRLSPPFGGVGGGFSIRRGDGGEAVDGLLVRLVVVVIEASSFPLGEVGLGLCPTLIPDNPSLIHPHLSLCTMTGYRVLSASSPLQPYQRIHGDYHH